MIIFNAKVLVHKFHTGVENYTKYILKFLKKNDTLSITVAKPYFKNRFYTIFWTQVILPFKKGDLLFSPANTAPIFIPKNKKSILTLHDVAFITQKETLSWCFRAYYQFIIPKIIKRADRIITVSEYSKNEILTYYPQASGKIESIPLGILPYFKPLEKTQKKNQILYVGTLQKRKNFTTVIEVFEQLQLQDYTLIIVGNFISNFVLDDATLALLDKAKKNPNIKILQKVSKEELVFLYSTSKIFFFPSLYEGFGLPILEAMACGTPVICSDIPALKEIGQDLPLYSHPTNKEEFKKNILKLLADETLQKSLSQQGIIHAQKFSWEKAVEKHLSILKETTNVS